LSMTRNSQSKPMVKRRGKSAIGKRKKTVPRKKEKERGSGSFRAEKRRIGRIFNYMTKRKGKGKPARTTSCGGRGPQAPDPRNSSLRRGITAPLFAWFDIKFLEKGKETSSSGGGGEGQIGPISYPKKTQFIHWIFLEPPLTKEEIGGVLPERGKSRTTIRQCGQESTGEGLGGGT